MRLEKYYTGGDILCPGNQRQYAATQDAMN